MGHAFINCNNWPQRATGGVSTRGARVMLTRTCVVLSSRSRNRSRVARRVAAPLYTAKLYMNILFMSLKSESRPAYSQLIPSLSSSLLIHAFNYLSHRVYYERARVCTRPYLLRLFFCAPKVLPPAVNNMQMLF